MKAILSHYRPQQACVAELAAGQDFGNVYETERAV
jgi:hypothetical protein